MEKRERIIRTGFMIVALLIVLRLAYWQLWRGDDLTAMAEGQRIQQREVYSPRGEILFSDGSVLVSNQPSYLVFVQPKIVKDKFSLAQRLAPIFAELDYGEGWAEKQKSIVTAPELEAFNLEKTVQVKGVEDEIYKNISKDLFWVSLNRTVDFQTKERIKALNIEGVGFDEKQTRFYPEGSSSAHLVGFVSSDIYGADKGYFGLEGFYNGELKGKKGVLIQEQDAHGSPILIGKFEMQRPSPGKTLVLNVDRTVQMIVEEKLRKGIEKYGAKAASAIVLEPKTGNVLAMATYPNYDPSHTQDFAKDFFKNPITIDTYEPGSTFKVLVMAAGINEGLVKPDTICTICSGPLSIGGFTIRTWNNKYQPNATMTDVIVHSDNTGMVFVGRKLGLDKMYEYLEKFGFGKSTGVDLEDEYGPPLREKESWREIDLATSSFGQGISVTGLQVVRAVAAIANGGKVMEPHVVGALRSDEGAVTIEPRVLSQPISPETATIVKEMMVKAVDEGEAKYAKPKGFRIAGKTGTAQIAVAGHYDPTKTIASFVGFAPADDPKFVMLVRYDQPQTSIYGSETAAPTFFEIAKELLNYYGIAPTESLR